METKITNSLDALSLKSALLLLAAYCSQIWHTVGDISRIGTVYFDIGWAAEVGVRFVFISLWVDAVVLLNYILCQCKRYFQFEHISTE